MTTAHCPSCDHLQYPPDGADLGTTKCRNCQGVGLVSGVGDAPAAPWSAWLGDALTQAERETARAQAEGEAA